MSLILPDKRRIFKSATRLVSRQYNIAISICLLIRKSCQHQSAERRSQRPEHATSHAKLQFREYQQERSGWRKADAASHSGAEIHCRPGSGLPFPVGLARIFSGWQRTSHVVVVVAVVVSSTGWPRSASWPGLRTVTSDKVPPARPDRAPWQQCPVQAGLAPHTRPLGSSLCPRVPDMIPVSPCVCLYLRTVYHQCACAIMFLRIKTRRHVFAR